jgi:uncharacterized protein DUF4443
MATMATWLKALEKREPGPSPGFSKAHALLAFMTIGEAGSIGRESLARKSGLGQGSIRTVLKKFRHEKYVSADTEGCHLTAAGKRLYDAITKKLSPIMPLRSSSLVVGPSQAAVLVRSEGRSVRSGIEQRDSAIMTGAIGATTYVIKDDRFAIPGGSDDCENDYPGAVWPVLRRGLSPEDGDAVIVCGAHDEKTAKLGVLSAALTLM